MNCRDGCGGHAPVLKANVTGRADTSVAMSVKTYLTTHTRMDTALSTPTTHHRFRESPATADSDRIHHTADIRPLCTVAVISYRLSL